MSFPGFVARAALGAVRRRLPLRIRNDLEGLLALDWPDRPPIGVGSFDAETVLIATTCSGGGIGACAGSMALHARADASNSIAIADFPQSTPAHTSVITSDALRAAFTAIDPNCQIYGLGADTSSALRNLIEILERLRPTVIYHPSLFTVDEGEKNLNLMLHRALHAVSSSSTGRWSPAIRGYETWAPVIANRYVDISGVINTKSDALQFLVPVLLHPRHVEAITALNIYRSQTFQKGEGSAEAFQEFTVTALDQVIALLGKQDAYSPCS